MNKLIYLIIFLFSCRICDAQFVKGTHLINLNLNGGFDAHSETDYADTSVSTGSRDWDYRTNNIIINPSFGFFIKENTVLSVGLTYRNQTLKSSASTNNSNTPETYSQRDVTNFYGALISYQRFYNIKGRLYWDYHLNAGYSYGLGEINQNDEASYNRTWKVYSHNVGLNAGAGFDYLLNNSWLVNAGIGNLGWEASWSKKTKANSSDTGSKYTDNHFHFNALYVSLGISYIIGNKAE